jgi:purine-nucleoside phosphorylase
MPQIDRKPTKQDFLRAANYIRRRTRMAPKIGLVLGSGLGTLAGAVEAGLAISYSEIPGWPEATVPGHDGRLVLGMLEGRAVAIMCGRLHFYEGYNLYQVTFPIRVFQQLGIDALILTNAAGAVNPDYQPGDIMLICDHMNFLGMAGLNPLRGPNDETLGLRFPDMSQVYDRRLSQAVRNAAVQTGLTLREGIYACLAGPSFETPAELRFLRAAGVDAVGMSTVPEAIVARHAGMRVLGLSGISNKANLDGSTITTHQEVLAAGTYIAPRLEMLLRGVLQTSGGDS